MIQAARLGSAVAGFVFAVAAVVLDDHRVGWAGIALLALSLLLRLVTRRRQQAD
ncbi:MAG TPA: hypothetical protein VEB59_04310 [Gemmatimonadales bacterium]|nr:hypothetical protein [Gemmatimonadales bacterium]